MNPEPVSKLWLVDKALDWTSFDVVRKIRNMTKIKKTGHAGTLDPLASGLLIVCQGKMTKQINTYQDQEKEYIGTFLLGKTTPSYDLETEFDSVQPVDGLAERQILDATNNFLGDLDQVPPAFSALKIGGRPAYLSARKGEKVELKARRVRLTEFEITSIQLPEVQFRIVCSKGFYVRSLARDFGDYLGVGAVLTHLRRTRIGDHHVKNAKTIEEIEQEIKRQYDESIQEP